MILAFIEDGTIALHATEAEAVRAYEGVDVESGVVTFYRDDGTWLEPVFTTPNRRGRFLGLFPWSASGVYRLEPRQNAAADPLWLALFEHELSQPAMGFDTKDQLKAHLASRGATVDKPASLER